MVTSNLAKAKLSLRANMDNQAMQSSPEEPRSRSSSRHNSSRRSSIKNTPSFEDSPRRSSLIKGDTSSRRGSFKKEDNSSRRGSIKKDEEFHKKSILKKEEEAKGGLKDEEVSKRSSVKGEESPKGTTKKEEGLPKKSNLKREEESKPSLKEDDRPQSAVSTPKRTLKPSGTLDFVVTGKQITKRCDRANSLPGGYHRRPSETKKKSIDKRTPHSSRSQGKSQETSLEEDMSLDLSQVSDFEDLNSKYGSKPAPLATSTPKPRPGPKPRSASLQSHIGYVQKMDSTRTQNSLDRVKSRDSTFSCSKDSFKTTSSSASPYRYGTELDYSSVSPEYSGQSSADLSPRVPLDLVVSPRSHHVSSCCVSSWQDYSEAEATKVEDFRADGEWNQFWVNYNNSLSKVPMKSYYDQCPTPYRTETIDLNDFDFSIHEGTRQRSPDNIKNINNIIRNEGLQLTPRETQNIIKCAHILGNVLSKAIERRSRENEITKIEKQINTGMKTEVENKKKNLTLDLKETAIPEPVNEEKRSETVTTQTDISLPNTKSAPIIFERILKQLSKSSIDEADEDDNVFDVKDKK